MVPAQNVSIVGPALLNIDSLFRAAPLIGTTAVTIIGNANATAAVVGNTVTLTGDMGWHFDESLKHAGPFY